MKLFSTWRSPWWYVNPRLGTLGARLRVAWDTIQNGGQPRSPEEMASYCAEMHQHHPGDCVQAGDILWYGGRRMYITKVCSNEQGKILHMNRLVE